MRERERQQKKLPQSSSGRIFSRNLCPLPKCLGKCSDWFPHAFFYSWSPFVHFKLLQKSNQYFDSSWAQWLLLLTGGCYQLLGDKLDKRKHWKHWFFSIASTVSSFFSVHRWTPIPLQEMAVATRIERRKKWWPTKSSSAFESGWYLVGSRIVSSLNNFYQHRKWPEVIVKFVFYCFLNCFNLWLNPNIKQKFLHKLKTILHSCLALTFDPPPFGQSSKVSNTSASVFDSPLNTCTQPSSVCQSARSEDRWSVYVSVCLLVSLVSGLWPQSFLALWCLSYWSWLADRLTDS